MIKLSNIIKITPPAYSDSGGKVIQPKTIELDTLNVTYSDNPSNKVYYATIQQIPSPIYLLVADEYDKYSSNINTELGKQRLLMALGDDPGVVLRKLFPKTLEENPNGAGTLLSKMIKSIGLKIESGCSCKQHAIEMNEKGNDWCEQNIDIIVDWLKKESQKRKIPFIDAIARLMVKRAIKKSKKLLANEPLPDNDEELDVE